MEQRYQAVLAVIGEGVPVTEVSSRFGVSRQTVHAWLAKYEAGGLAALADRSHAVKSCPHQMEPEVEVLIVQMRLEHRGWGPRRIEHELARAGVFPMPSRSGIYRALKRAKLIDPDARRRRSEKFRRWERGGPMELWQMDIVGGVLLADGTVLKVLTGVDDHSRFCVCAGLMVKATSRAVCEHLSAAMRVHGVPQEILTDNGKQFTGRFGVKPVEVLFDRICRENGIDHLLTAPRSPTTTGKIERFHRTLRAEFLTDRVFASKRAAQRELDEWVGQYNTARPHQSLDMATPSQRFTSIPSNARAADDSALVMDRTGDEWITRRVGGNGVICIAWQQISVGKHRAGHNVDIHVGDKILHIWDGQELLKTAARSSRGEVRKKRASIAR